MNYIHQELLLLTFARVNPVFFGQVWKALREEDQGLSESFAAKVLGLGFPPTFVGYCSHSGRSLAGDALTEVYGTATKIPLTTLCHAFPVWCEPLACGMMVPLAIEPSDDWHISDAFGSFDFLEGERGRPLVNLCKVIELRWRELHLGTVLPLRWRQALDLKILCPIHMQAIAGNSLHVPLIVSIVRALAGARDTSETAALLPFGNVPVFATGALSRDGNTFWPVERVREKLTGFVREYGEGLPALLQGHQIKDLPADLLGKVQSREVNSIDDLLALPELNGPLHELCQEVHPSEIDTMLQVMSRHNRAIRFDDVDDMICWLNPMLKSPVYQFRMHREQGLILAHHGKLVEAREEFRRCLELQETHVQTMGIHDLCDMATLAGVIADDSLDVDLAEPLLQRLAPHLGQLSIDKRVAYWGTRCQLYRLEQCYEDAVAAGEEAVRLADLGRASDSGRDRNYLIHALLGRARQEDDWSRADLNRSAQLLAESKGLWAPRDNERNRRSHLGFCLHLQAELARLNRERFSPPDAPPWSGSWGHPWYFALLSCARNQAYGPGERLGFAERLVNAIGKHPASSNPSTLFYMFSRVYQIYTASLGKTNSANPRSELMDWCEQMATVGMPGWQKRLKPCLEVMAKEPDNRSMVEQLCDLVPYH